MQTLLNIPVSQYPEHTPCSGKLLIVGGARCVWDDLLKIDRSDFDIMCVNDIIMHYPEDVKHGYSNDFRMLPKWIEARRPGLNTGIIPHSCFGPSSWPWPGHGNSGLNACYTGLGLGYSEIVLAGMPMDDSGHYFDPPWIKTNYSNLSHYWTNAFRNVFEGRVSER